MYWSIEYTGLPPLKRKDRKRLEQRIQNSIKELVSLLKGERDCLELGQFWAERIDVPALEKPLIAIIDAEANWVGTLTLQGYPSLSLAETKKILRKLEVDLPYLIPIAQKTVEEAILELEESLKKSLPEEVLEALRFLKNLYGEALKEGVISANDKIKDAHRKILNHIEKQTPWDRMQLDLSRKVSLV